MDTAVEPKRVVTLIASATEIVNALGCRDWIVGRSHECDFPADIKSLPVLTEPKFPVEGSSGEIDKRIKTIVADSLSVYRVFPDRLADVSPDVIVTQDQCEVCAVSLRDVEEAVCTLSDTKADIVSLKPDCLADLWTDIASVAEQLGIPDRGEALTASLRQRMTEITDKAATLDARPSVASIDWIDPLMASGNWMPELIEMAGGQNLFGEAGKHAPWLEWDAVRDSDPDIILVQPCGFDIARTLEEMHLLAAQPGWGDMKAVKAGNVIVADGNQYFNRPGPRLVESLEILAEIQHPDAFDFGHKDVGWVRWDGGS